ncbi:Uncharacterised protein [Mycobacteroides abscessus subsp. massiliense]|nr:Uncharacterised protein [Mycobacteroides abscessus subsp. massiliense]
MPRQAGCGQPCPVRECRVQLLDEHCRIGSVLPRIFQISGKSSGRPTKRYRQRIRQRDHTRARLQDQLTPSGRLEPERRRHGLHRQRAGRHHGAAMRARQLRQGIGRVPQIRRDDPQHPLGHNHRAGIENILTG